MTPKSSRAAAFLFGALVLVGHQPEQGWPAITRLAVLARGRWQIDAPRPADPAAAAVRYREALDG